MSQSLIVSVGVMVSRLSELFSVSEQQGRFGMQEMDSNWFDVLLAATAALDIMMFSLVEN